MRIDEHPLPARRYAAAGGGGASWSSAQIIALVMGVWWTINGIGAFLIDPNFATGHVHGGGDVFNVVAITANGWHALFHLLSGLVGIFIANRPRAALAFTLIAGAIYIVIGSWGLLAGGSSLGVIAVDRPGDVVHLAEGLIALTPALVAAVGRTGWLRSR